MDEAAIGRALMKRIDDSIFSACGLTSTVPAPPPEPFTLAKLQRLMVSMQPTETWLSTRLFPDSNAITVEGPGERFTVAHPTFWLKLEIALRESPDVRTVSGPPPLFSMNLRPTEIDPYEGDDEETAKWRAAHWDRLKAAMTVAMQPLPEWLRSAPKFGTHG